MIEHFRFTWQLLVLASIILLAGIPVILLACPWIAPGELVITVVMFTLITLVAYLVMARGIDRGGREGMVFMMAGLGLKFLLYLLYILGFWLVTKNIDKPFILTFFALYLVFTIFLAGNLLKILRNK